MNMSHNLILNSLLFIFIFPQLIDRLHKYGFCLSKTTKYTIQEEIGHHFLDRAIELLKQGRKFVLVLDNIDGMLGYMKCALTTRIKVSMLWLQV